MKQTQLAPNFSVSDQISVSDIEQIAVQGVKRIICNRPDKEAADQPDFAEISTKASEHGIETVCIPFTSGQLNDELTTLFTEQCDPTINILAYCRTGNRSTQIWNASQGNDHTSQPKTVTERQSPTAKPHYDVVIVGAGSAGIATAASLLKRRPQLRICLVDPAEYHFYQPGWTMVGGGIFDIETTRRKMETVIPANTTWIKKAVAEFAPDSDNIVLEDGSEVYYDHLVVAAGIKLNWDAIEGLSETLGKNGVTSNYRYDLAPYTWKLVNKLKDGKAVFTQPPMPIKCAGAPQKAMYLSCSEWFSNGSISKINVNFYNAGGVLFGVKDYVPALEKYVQKYNAHLHFLHTLTRVDGPNKKAYFSYKPAEGEEQIVETDFDMLHVCPSQCAPDFIRNSPLVDAAGWVDVDQFTLCHKQHGNVWGLGDVTNTPNAKTMAAARKQAPVVAQNICEVLDKRTADYVYDGYGSCPLTVERGKIVLAEFGYGGKLLPSFPSWLNDGTKPSSIAWWLKASFLPAFYWKGMLKAHEWMAAPHKQKK